MKATCGTAAATIWLSRPCASRKARPSGVSGTRPRPTSLETKTIGYFATPRNRVRRRASISGSRCANIRFDSHNVRQSTSTARPWVASRDRPHLHVWITVADRRLHGREHVGADNRTAVRYLAGDAHAHDDRTGRHCARRFGQSQIGGFLNSVVAIHYVLTSGPCGRELCWIAPMANAIRSVPSGAPRPDDASQAQFVMARLLARVS